MLDNMQGSLEKKKKDQIGKTFEKQFERMQVVQSNI